MTGPAGDAQLVAGLRAGDRDCLAALYDRYADRLHDFCASMLRDRDDAADAVQDTFVLAARRIGQLRDADRLRPWLYAIARSVALDRIRARARVRPTEAVTDTVDPAAGPERLAEQEALRRLVADAAEGLPDADRAMLRLHLHGLEGAELGAALGISARTAYVRLSRLRDQVERTLGAMLVARLGRRDCPDLAAVLGAWDGRFTPLLRKRVVRHIDGCDVCARQRDRVASPWALLSGAVFLPAPPELRDRVLGGVRLVGHGARRKPDGRTLVATFVVAALLSGVGVLWRGFPGVEVPAVDAGPLTAAATGSATASAAAVPGPRPALTVAAAPAPSSAAPLLISPTRVSPSATPPSVTPPPAPEPVGPPRITGQAASPPRIGVRGCRAAQTAVTVTLARLGPATSAVLTWTGAGGAGSAAMRGSGTSWTGVLGPFPAPGRVQWSVTVRNAAGSATGAARTLVVSTC